MPKYTVEVQFHGYSRGYKYYEIEAENEEEAEENWYEGEEVGVETHRTDQEHEVVSVSENK